jgi:glycosyltransferase involved in cell wall biosynthesis
MTTILLEAVGIDRFGGTRTALLSLFTHMFALDRQTRYIVLLSAEEPTLKPFPNVEQKVVSVTNRFGVRLEIQAKLPRLIRRERVHLTHFTKNLGAFGLPCPYIVTVHDLTTLLMKNSRADVLYYRLVEPRTLRGAAQLVAVSRDAAKDVERVYGIPRESIEVVYWAPDSRFGRDLHPDRIATVRQRYGLPERYILFIGILAKKKNLPTLLRALARVRAVLPDAPDLVVAGRQYPQSSDTESVPLVHRLGLGDHVHFIGGVPNEDVPPLYAGAELYVLPSLHEGFGIPLLEAMACGVPVLTTGGGSLPEVAGDAAWVVENPLDVEAFCEAILRLLSDQALRSDLIGRGYRRVAEYSWEKSAQAMLDLYDSVLKKVGK